MSVSSSSSSSTPPSYRVSFGPTTAAALAAAAAAAASPAAAPTQSISTNGHQVSTNLTDCPRFEDINKIAVDSFGARERPGGHIEIFHASAKPPPAADKVKTFMTPGKKSTKLDAQVKAQYEQLTVGLKVGEDGTLIREQDGYKLGIKPEQLAAMIRASLKTKDASTRAFSFLTSENRTARMFRFEQHHFVSVQMEPFARGGGGQIYQGLDLISRELVVAKETQPLDQDDIESEKEDVGYTPDKTAVEKERDNLEYFNPDNHSAIIHKPMFAFRFLEGGLSTTGIIVDFCSKGSLETFLSRGKPSFEQSLKNLQIIGTGIAMIDQKLGLHADLKLGNIFVHGDGSACVADFDGVLRLDDQQIRQSAAKLAAGGIYFSRSTDCMLDVYDKKLSHLAKSLTAAYAELDELQKAVTPKNREEMAPKIRAQTTKIAQLEGFLRQSAKEVHSSEFALLTLLSLSGRGGEGKTPSCDDMLTKKGDDGKTEVQRMIETIEGRLESDKDKTTFRNLMNRALPPPGTRPSSIPSVQEMTDVLSDLEILQRPPILEHPDAAAVAAEAAILARAKVAEERAAASPARRARASTATMAPRTDEHPSTRRRSQILSGTTKSAIERPPSPSLEKQVQNPLNQ